MRIFSAVRHSLDERRFLGGLWSGNFHPALRQLGHEVVESRVDLAPAMEFSGFAPHFTRLEIALRGQLTERILDEVRRAHAERPIQLFLGYFYSSLFDPGAYAELHRLGIVTVNFYCNSMYQFGLVRDVAARVQWSWHAERDARPLYVVAGARPVWVQMGADPDVYRPEPGVTRDPSACFVGTRYADRDRWIAALLDAGIPIALYGHGWGASAAANSNKPSSSRPRVRLGRCLHPPGSLGSYCQLVAENVQHEGLRSGLRRTWKQWQYRRASRNLGQRAAIVARPPVPTLADIRRTFASHEIVLNFSNVWSDGRPGSDLIPHVRLRDFEGPMCRSSFLTGYSDELGEFYDLGREVDTYRSTEELVDKVRHYLKHPGEAERLRAAGYERARRDHTWVQRFRQLFRAVGLET
ncbi:MAG TPA: glycosyltransferase [Gemmatales bacterium]|nr:glycosyltransferase [Gemmatales bacterium]HMP60383.1 glycosyltransferase [Gemmatales bacterium]